ncbi:MAG: helix-turn-helix transcriptional regulator [Eubacteriaceae bacterium]
MYERLRLLRSEKKVSATQMKRVLGLKTEAAYYKKEAGDIKFSLQEARKISRFFSMQIEEIFFDDKVSHIDTLNTTG